MWSGDPLLPFYPTKCSHARLVSMVTQLQIPGLTMLGIVPCKQHCHTPVTHPLLLAQKWAFPVLPQVMVRKPGCEPSLTTVHTWIFFQCFYGLLTVWIHLGLYGANRSCEGVDGPSLKVHTAKSGSPNSRLPP